MKEMLNAFGERLKLLRKERKLTQEELAANLGVHTSYIGLLERQERVPSLITLDRIAKYFGIKPYDLISSTKKPQKYSFKQKELLYIIEEGTENEIEKLYKISRIVIGQKKRT